MQGFGEFTSNDGRYIGRFERNTYNGAGKYFYSNESIYIGGFSGGKRNGKGIWISSQNSYQEGLWEQDKFLESEAFSLCDLSSGELNPDFKEFTTADDLCRIARAYLGDVENKKYSMSTARLMGRALGILHNFAPQAMAVDVLKQVASIITRNSYAKEAIRSGDASLYGIAASCMQIGEILSLRISELTKIAPDTHEEISNLTGS